MRTQEGDRPFRCLYANSIFGYITNLDDAKPRGDTNAPTNQDITMKKAFSDYYLPKEIIESDKDDSSMSTQHILDLLSDAAELFDLVDPSENLEDWVEFKISRAKQDISDVKSYLKNNPHAGLTEQTSTVTSAKTPSEQLADMLDIPLDELVKHGTNELALKNVVFDDQESIELREEALSKIFKEEYLTEIALKSDVKKFRNTAASKVELEENLKNLAKKGPGGVRWRAAQKLKDQDLLLNMALNDQYEAIKVTALPRITDQKKLKEFFLKSKDEKLKDEALNRIEDPAFLKKVALDKGQEDSLKYSALEKIDDEKTLFNIAQDPSAAPLLKEKSILKIKNQEMLKKLFQAHEMEWKLREILVQKIENKNFLKEAAKMKKELDPDVRMWAVKKLTDKKFLNKMLEEEAETAVKDAIKLRLQELS